MPFPPGLEGSAGEAAAEHAASRFVTLPFVNIIVPPPVAEDSQADQDHFCRTTQADSGASASWIGPLSLGVSRVPVALSFESIAPPVVVAVVDGCDKAKSARHRKKASH